MNLRYLMTHRTVTYGNVDEAVRLDESRRFPVTI